MASKKKTYTQGEMRPISALARQNSSSSKKKNAPTRVPEPQKLPQYSVPQTGAPVRNTDVPVKENNVSADEAADQLFKSVKELEDMKNEVPKEEQVSATALEPISVPKPEQKLKPKPVPVPVPAPKPEVPKPEPKPPVAKAVPKTEHKKVPVKTADDTVVPFTKPGLKPFTEYKQEDVRPVPARRRGVNAPDLSNKAEREAFFSKYTTVTAKKSRETYPEITEEYIKMQEPVKKPIEEKRPQKRVNPFLAGKTERPVISHAKEDDVQIPISAKPDDEPEKDSLSEIQEMLKKHSSDNSAANIPAMKEEVIEVTAAAKSAVDDNAAPSEMCETIEGAIKLQKKEREEAAKALKDSEDLAAAQRKSSIFRAAGIMGTIAVCGAFLLLGERSDFSAEENRKLAEMPEFSWSSYLNGEYTAGVASFYNDTVPMRSTFKKMISSMSNWKGLPSDNEEEVTFFGNVAVKDEKKKDDGSAEMTENVTDAAGVIDSMQTTAVSDENSETSTTTTEEEEYEPPVEVGDSIIIHKKRAICFYGGTDELCEAYAEDVNEYKKRLPDVNVYSMIAPTSVSFYLPDEYKDYTASEKEKIDYVNSLLKDVTPVDVYSALEKHKDEAIYARTDHHWLPLGAYYAAQEFAKTAGVQFTDISDMDSETKEGYCGSMYTYTQSTILSDNPEDFTYYKPRNTYRTRYYYPSFEFDYEGDLLLDMTNFDPVSYYLVFMCGDAKIVNVSTDVKNDRKLVIFKDSYANATIPCLVGSFSEIYVCDIRYFEVNAIDFCKEVGATDVLFCMNTFSATGGNEECIDQILNQ